MRIHTQGTSTASGSYAAWYLPFSDYVIKSGDRIHWRQYQDSAKGGIGISFVGGGSTNWSTHDTDGEVMNSDSTEGSWHQRTVDLTPFAGKTVQHLHIVADSGTPVGNWVILYGDISIVSADGTVTTIYDRASSESFSYFTGGGETNQQAWIEHTTTSGSHPEATTSYYLADHLGSTRMMLAYGGWPLSTDTYYPYGQEPSPPADNNHYKFAGLERDAESGLDHTQFRQYASVMGRWMSPDPYMGSYDPSNPQTFNRYSYVLNMPLAYTDPSGQFPIGCGFGGKVTEGLFSRIWNGSWSGGSLRRMCRQCPLRSL